MGVVLNNSLDGNNMPQKSSDLFAADGTCGLFAIAQQRLKSLKEKKNTGKLCCTLFFSAALRYSLPGIFLPVGFFPDISLIAFIFPNTPGFS